MANHWQRYFLLLIDPDALNVVLATGLPTQRIVLGIVDKVEEHDSQRLEERQNAVNLSPHFEMLS